MLRYLFGHSSQQGSRARRAPLGGNEAEDKLRCLARVSVKSTTLYTLTPHVTTMRYFELTSGYPLPSAFRQTASYERI